MDLQPSSNSQEEMNQNGKTTAAADEKKRPRPQPDQAEKCPRCDSGNTKFCYYNNYSLTQPRYFCKACRRYWTKGGTLRNVPVGGGCRKNRRSSKRAFDYHNSHLLVQSHNQIENNDKNNNVMLSSALFDTNNKHSNLRYLRDHSNFSSPLQYEDSGTCDGLSLAFATLQRHSNVHHLGFEFGPQNSILGHQPIRTSSTNDLGFFSNFFEPETTKSFNNSQSLYNYGAQPLPLSYDDYLSSSNMTSKGSSEMKQEMNGDVNGNRILLGLPWLVDNNNNGVVGQESFEKSNNYNYYNNEGCYEVEGGGRSERWNNNNNNTGLVAAGGSSWPNLTNTTALIM